MSIDEFRVNEGGSVTVSHRDLENGWENWVEMYFLQNAFFSIEDTANIYVYMGKDVASAKRNVPCFVGSKGQARLGLQTWQNEYNKILDYLERMRGWHSSTLIPILPYHIYDINQDGIPEMFLWFGTGNADHRDLLLTVDMVTGQARYVTALSNGHSDIYVTNEPNVFLRIHRKREGTKVVKYTVVGNQLGKITLSEAEAMKYQNAMRLPHYMNCDRLDRIRR